MRRHIQQLLYHIIIILYVVGINMRRTGGFISLPIPMTMTPSILKPGTLRHAVIQTKPLGIIFQRDMVIQLKEELIMNSYKTIDGRGANVHIANGACITIQCRHENFHVVNNDYTHWEMYTIGGSANPTINSQGNRFLAPDNQFHKEVTKHQDSKEGNWRSLGDLMLNGGFEYGGQTFVYCGLNHYSFRCSQLQKGLELLD